MARGTLIVLDAIPADPAFTPSYAERREFLAYVSPPDSDAQEGFRASLERREPSWR